MRGDVERDLCSAVYADLKGDDLITVERTCAELKRRCDMSHAVFLLGVAVAVVLVLFCDNRILCLVGLLIAIWGMVGYTYHLGRYKLISQLHTYTSIEIGMGRKQ